jgi:hypothetical protein
MIVLGRTGFMIIIGDMGLGRSHRQIGDQQIAALSGMA